MLVTFVSQCEKKALNRTRRVLDAFANRIGNNVWQTAITEEGLSAVKKLLRQTASKSTAVSCHRVRSRQRSELVWVVGCRKKFNEAGVVAVNRTKRNILHGEWENNWQYAGSIQIIATIAALLHDVGKSTIGFQNKLSPKKGTEKQSVTCVGDPYRHEWISLKLFLAMLDGCNTDDECFNRLANPSKWPPGRKITAGLAEKNIDTADISSLPPLAQWLAWLVVTHHRLPPAKSVFMGSSERKRIKEQPWSLANDINQFYSPLAAFDFWVKNPKILGEKSKKYNKDFTQFNDLVINSPCWQAAIKRWSNKALQDPGLKHLSDAHQNKQAIGDGFVLYLSRLALMIGDHNYSSLNTDDKRRIRVSCAHQGMVANSDRKTGEPKQYLDEHLLGVAGFTAQFARFLPVLATELPALKQHNPLAKDTANGRFLWQNRAVRLSRAIQASSREQGFFGVNMASTGCGKTIGNARIMYALADPNQGARFTIALGLRVLTLQTGRSFRQDLGLSDKQLAILVGGRAHKKLFEMEYDQKTQITGIHTEHDQRAYTSAVGSDSSQALVDEIVDSGITEDDYGDFQHLNIDTLLADNKARELLFAPIITCTIDHIMQASECKRGGGYIAPILRLLSSDLILDEPDDFDHHDLPALARLVHLAGMFGSRVLLSSATLTPDLVAGLFQAYLAGRTIYHHSQNKTHPKVICAWFDEQPAAMKYEQCSNGAQFREEHQQFVQQRCCYLNDQPVRRRAAILDLPALRYNKEQHDDFYDPLAQTLIDAAISLHRNHHVVEEKSGKRVSIGLIRIANIKHITALALRMLGHDNISIREDTHIHLTCYHAKQLLVLRNHLESKLDRILKRDQDNPQGIFHHSEISDAISNHPAKNHLFIVLGSPVTEVGRDHDYDWGIVEPSSMRSIIQLAGRIWRHRPDKEADHCSNLLLLRYNIRYFVRQGRKPVFTHPGFETDQIKPKTYDLSELIPPAQLERIDAQPRIQAACNDPQHNISANNEESIKTLVGLEHRLMATTLNNPELNHVNAYWHEEGQSNRINTHLQQLSPFRDGPPQDDWLLIPDEPVGMDDHTVPSAEAALTSSGGFKDYAAEDVYEKTIGNATRQGAIGKLAITGQRSPGISPWLSTTLRQALVDLQQQWPEKSINALAVEFASVSLDRITTRNSNGWYFNEFLGFIRKE